jgi:hypothetical protein
MPEISRYWRGWTEKQLAGFQQNQGSTNHCAKYAAASTLNLLYGSDLVGEYLISWLDTRPFKGTGLYTIFGNNYGSLVFQTANLIRKLAHSQGLDPKLKCRVGSITDLQESLSVGNLLNVVSVSYFQGQEPVIARGTNITSSLGTTHLIGGHLMILGAYDHAHHNQAGQTTPWGFISSWSSKEELYWMSQAEFRRTWGGLSLYNMISVKS